MSHCPPQIGQNFGPPLWSSLLFSRSFLYSPPSSIDGLSFIMELGSSDPYSSLFHLHQFDITELILVRRLIWIMQEVRLQKT